MAEQRLIGLWTDCFNIVIDLLETSCYLFSNFEFMIWFFFYIPLMPRGHACGGHNAHGAVSGTWRKRPRFHFKFRPSAQKKEARKGPGNRLNVRFASKTRFLLPTQNYRNRGRTSAIR